MVSSGRFRFLQVFWFFFLIFSSTEKLTFWHTLNLKMIFNSGYKKKPYLPRCLEPTLVLYWDRDCISSILIRKRASRWSVYHVYQSLAPKEYVKFYELIYTLSKWDLLYVRVSVSPFACSL